MKKTFLFFFIFLLSLSLISAYSATSSTYDVDISLGEFSTGENSNFELTFTNNQNTFSLPDVQVEEEDNGGSSGGGGGSFGSVVSEDDTEEETIIIGEKVTKSYDDDLVLTKDNTNYTVTIINSTGDILLVELEELDAPIELRIGSNLIDLDGDGDNDVEMIITSMDQTTFSLHLKNYNDEIVEEEAIIVEKKVDNEVTALAVEDVNDEEIQEGIQEKTSFSLPANLLYIIVGFVIVFLLIFVVLKLKKRPKKSTDSSSNSTIVAGKSTSDPDEEPFIRYAKSHLDAGMKEEELINKFRLSGWKDEQINHYMKILKEKYNK